jgi:RNA polymerase sigma-70 factor (ECF subfamily)
MNQRVFQAIEQLKAGDASSFRMALESLTGMAFAFAKKVCGNADDAEDIAQETMLQLVPSIHQFSDARRLGVWLYKVAKTRCLMSRRTSKFSPARTLSLSDLMPSHADAARLAESPWPVSPEEVLLRAELREQLERAILKLPERYRLVLVLRDIEQLDVRETAAALGISEATVKMRLHRGRVFLRNELDAYLRSLPSKDGRRG